MTTTYDWKALSQQLKANPEEQAAICKQAEAGNPSARFALIAIAKRKQQAA